MVKNQKYVIVICFFLIQYFHVCTARSVSVNDLKKALKIAAKDTARVKALIESADDSLRSNPGKAFEYATEALKLSKKLDYTEGIANCHTMLGSYYYYTSEFAGARKEFELAKKQYLVISDDEGVAICYNNLGGIYLKLGYFIESMENFTKAGEIFEKTGYMEGAASLYNNMAIICKKQGNHDEALNYYKKALEINTRINDIKALSSNLHNLGSLSFELGNNNEAIDYFTRALKLCKVENDDIGYARTVQAIATVYQDMGKITQAIDCYTKASVIFNKVGDLDAIAECLNKTGVIYFNDKKIEQARKNFEQSLKIGKTIGSLPLQRFAYGWLIEVDSIQGNMVAALSKYSMYKLICDSILNEEKSHQLTDLRLKYEKEKAENQQQLTQLAYENLIKESSLQKNRYIIALLSLCVLLITITTIIIFQKRRITSQRKIFNLELEKLRQQINPHFLFNSLNSLQSYIFNGDKSASYTCLNKLTRLLRIILENSQQNTVSIQDEIDFLALYIDLMKIRFKNNIDYVVDVDKNIDTHHFKIPSFLLQTYVENSICHGFQGERRGKGMIKVKFSLSGDLVNCTIEDNGIGRSKAMELKRNSQFSHLKSFGTKISEERLRLLNSIYRKKLDIRFTDLTDKLNRPKGTRVELSFPVLMN